MYISDVHTFPSPCVNQCQEISKYFVPQVLQSMKHLVCNNQPVIPHYSTEKLKTILNDQDTLKSTGWLSLHKAQIESLQKA